MPEGCIPPQPPKPPTECEMAYVLGQQVTEQWGSMLVEDSIDLATVQRDNMIVHQQDFNNPDFVDNYDTSTPNTNGEKEYYANATFDISNQGTTLYNMEYFVEVTCPNGETYSSALSNGFETDCGTDTLTPQTDLDASGACFNTLLSKVQAFSNETPGYVMKPKLHSCGAEGVQCASAQKMVVCGSQLLRKGWSDNVRRSYDSNYRSAQCKNLFKQALDSVALNNGVECNYYHDTTSTPALHLIKYCPNLSKPYCDLTTKTCVEAEPTNHVLAADWTTLSNTEPACRFEPTQGGFKQKLESCFAPDGTMISNCTEVSYKLSLIDRIKACFRRELKKGGFTIEKVCLYQSVSKSFKNISDIESYIAKSITNKKCIKFSPTGACTKYGYAPRIGLKCDASEVIHNGITTDGTCYYYYSDPRDTKANDELILRDYEFEISRELFWKAKFETSTGAQLLAEYSFLVAKSTVSECLMHNFVSEVAMATCANNITVSDTYQCPAYETKKSYDMCSSYDANGDCVCFENSGREAVGSSGACTWQAAFADSQFEHCTRFSDDGLQCEECGNLVTEKNKSDNTFRRCNNDHGTFCPQMCATCEHFINEDLSADEDYHCITCAAGWFLEGTSCVNTANALAQEHLHHCERFSAKVVDECVQCHKGYAFNTDGKCEQIKIGLGCAAGDHLNNCVCMAGFEVVETEQTGTRALLPANLTPGLFNPSVGCKARTDSLQHCLMLNTSGNCLYCQVGFYLNEADGTCKSIQDYKVLNTGIYEAYVGNSAAPGQGYGCMHMYLENATWYCTVPLPGYKVDVNNIDVTESIVGQVDYCFREIMQQSGLAKCYECLPGYVSNEAGNDCRKLETATIDENVVEVLTVEADTKFVGCRVENADGRCLECKEGYHQANLKHNDSCVVDGMFHCHTFLDSTRDSCACNYDSIQTDKANNNQCANVAEDVTYYNRVWKDQVSMNNYAVSDSCFKVKAVRMFLCNQYDVIGDTAYTGLDHISAAYVATQETNTAIAENDDWLNYKRLVAEQLPKIRGAWKRSGVIDDAGSNDFCTLSAQA